MKTSKKHWLKEVSIMLGVFLFILGAVAFVIWQWGDTFVYEPSTVEQQEPPPPPIDPVADGEILEIVDGQFVKLKTLIYFQDKWRSIHIKLTEDISYGGHEPHQRDEAQQCRPDAGR